MFDIGWLERYSSCKSSASTLKRATSPILVALLKNFTRFYLNRDKIGCDN
jgi:hypothetical protein